jgi:hypothetical protein
MAAAAAYVWNIQPLHCLRSTPCIAGKLAAIVSLALTMLIAPLLTSNSTSSLFNWGALRYWRARFSGTPPTGLHYVFSMLADFPDSRRGEAWCMVYLFSHWLCFALLFCIQSLIRANPAVVAWRYPIRGSTTAISDPLFTRITFQVWPVKAPGC